MWWWAWAGGWTACRARAASTSPPPPRSWRRCAWPRTWATSRRVSAAMVVALRPDGSGRPRRRAQGHRRHGRPAARRRPSEPRPDHGGHAGPRPRRSVRQYRPRLQLRRRHPHGAQARRHLPHRGRLRDRSRRREVLRHQVPAGRAPARRGHDRGHGAGAQVPRRRAAAGARQGERGGARARPRQPRGARRLHPAVQGARADRAQPLPDRHRGGVQGGDRPLRVARRAGLCRRHLRAGAGKGARTSRAASSSSSTRERSAFAPLYPLDASSRPSSRPSPRASTAPTASTIRRRWTVRSPRPRRSATADCPSASPRRSGRCPTTRPCSTGRAISGSRSTTCGSPPGAGFLVALAGDITTMPGLPRKSNAEGVDVTPDGAITGLF